jgi:hypothetical protein
MSKGRWSIDRFWGVPSLWYLDILLWRIADRPLIIGTKALRRRSKIAGKRNTAGR